jgi:hypothetical protein
MAGVVVEEQASNTTEPSPLDQKIEDETILATEEKALADYATSQPLSDSEDSSVEEITSQPVPGGNWNPDAPLDWCKDFGRRSPEYEEYLKTITKLGPGDEGYFDVSDMLVPNVTIVRSKEQARVVVDKLMNADPSIFHACDTEVMDIDLKEVGPVGNGYVTCVSVYSGPDFDYGLGQGPGTTLWIDNIDDAHGVLQEFKEWFEDERFLKVWHNYGFDRHVMWNEGIDVKGFGGDTMHMARLQDTSRMKNGGGGYSLEALTAELLNMRKRPMKEIFGVPRIKKDGTPGSLVDVPPVDVLQRDPRFRKNFIQYSCYDALGTWQLHEKLVALLKKMSWVSRDTNMYDYYWRNMREFGAVLTDMERRGIRVDAKDYLASVEEQARKDRDEHSKKFRQWAAGEIGIDGLALNPASATQLATFLFGGSENLKTKKPTEAVRVFKVAREEIPEDALEAFTKTEQEQSKKNSGTGKVLRFDVVADFGTRNKSSLEACHLFEDDEPDQLAQMTAVQLKALCKEYGLKVSGKKADLQDRLREHLLKPPEIESKMDEFDEMSDDELRQSLAARNMDESGERAEMLQRIREDIQFVSELENVVPNDSLGHATIIEALETAASKGGVTKEILAFIKEKATEEPKHIDITIKSLGMQPIKYTAGGAPSVTADVLRELAGDPFENPPRYGTVSNTKNVLSSTSWLLIVSIRICRLARTLEVETEVMKPA